MNKKIFGLITLILCLLAGCVNSSIEGTGSIRGVVTDKSTNAPLQGVNVVLVSDDGTNNTQTTISDGSYVFSQLFNGTYTLEFSKEEYESYKKTITIDGDGTKDGSVSLSPIKVELTVTPSSLNFGDLETSKELYVSCASRSVSFSIKTDVDWLTASPTEGIANNSGTKITLVANRDLIDYGTQTTVVKINSSLGETGIPVSVTKIQESAPEVSTYTTIDSIIGERSIKISGTIISTGSNEIIRYGHCYSQKEMPTIEDGKSNLGKTKAIGNYSSILTDLEPGKVYYIRAYAENSAGLVYSKEQARVEIPLITKPDVATGDANNIKQEKATLRGIIQSNGGADIIECGFYYGTNENLATKIKSETVSEIFECTLAGLTSNTSYYYKAYAINSKGEACGDTLSFTTLKKQENAPEVSTNTAIDSIIGEKTVKISGTLLSIGSSDIIRYGHCYGQTEKPTIEDSKTNIGKAKETGTFSSILTDLEPGKNYYVRAYAENSVGLVYSKEQAHFEVPLITTPEAITIEAANILQEQTTLKGAIQSNGGVEVTECGFYYGTDENVSNKVKSNSIGDIFEFTLSGLKPETTYYYKAYATNSKGEAYGKTLSFKTLGYAFPEVITSEVINIAQEQATLKGSIQTNGGSDIIECGFYYGVNQSMTSKVKVSTTGDVFEYTLGNLEPGTSYYCKAYAINKKGESSGATVSFTTMEYAFPEVITGEVINITQEQATLKGSIQTNGGSDIIECGFYYGTGSMTNKLKTTATGGIFEYTITNLEPETVYNYKAYAINKKGEACGETLSFKTATKVQTEPEVETLDATKINFEQALLRANIVSQGASDISQYGFYWGKNSNPTIRVIVGESAKEGVYTYELKELEENTTYYYKAFAKNSGGYSYGTVQSFTTTGKPRFTEWVSIGYGRNTYSDLYAKFETYGATVVEAGFLFGDDYYKSDESTLHINSYDIIKKCEIIDNTISGRIDHPSFGSVTYYCRPYFELENGEIYYGKVRYLYDSGKQSDL